MLISLDDLDCDRVLYTREKIYEILPQKHEFAQLDAIIHVDAKRATVAGYRDVRADEWWCRGHVPGKPIFPGVLMVECSAQLAAFGTHFVMPHAAGFMGFGGIDKAKFRDSVIPPARVVLMCRAVEVRKRRIICDNQAYVDGKIVFEGTITGLRLQW
ncbi:MAG: beta-hydroxyacyl-ACP dehydratase [Phycisphaerae bacterium]|nr:beta-hydroxyacyl-ACP dehydratase [Phycisphaerae bacterium]